MNLHQRYEHLDWLWPGTWGEDPGLSTESLSKTEWHGQCYSHLRSHQGKTQPSVRMMIIWTFCHCLCMFISANLMDIFREIIFTRITQKILIFLYYYYYFFFQDKAGPYKEIYPYLIQELEPTLSELGISTPEELGMDKV